MVTVSRCDYCKAHLESSEHLFLTCPFAKHIWQWLSQTFRKPPDLSSPKDLIASISHSISRQAQNVMISAIIKSLCFLWRTQNLARFHNGSRSFQQIRSNIISVVSISGNCSHSTMHSSMEKFSIFKFFSIAGHVNKAPKIKVMWYPLSV